MSEMQVDARPRWLIPALVAAVLVLAAAVAVGVGAVMGRSGKTPVAAPSPSAQTLHITGAVFMPGGPSWTMGDHCAGGITNWRGVHEGSQVRVLDGAGAVIGIGALADGEVVDSPTYPGLSKACRFTFEATVPGGLPIYGVDVPPFAGVQYTQTQIADPLRLVVS